MLIGERLRSHPTTQTTWALAAAVLATPARGASSHPDLAEMDIEELMQIEVTAASKHPQAAAAAPSSVTTITAVEIRRFGWRTLAEALRSVPGFYTSYDRNYEFVGVRGFLRPGDFSDRILLLVNGHTYNDDIYQQAYVDPTFGIDLEAVERIEVVRGPGSALYGGNALFAVINVVTASAHERPGLRVLAETGSFGRKRGHFTFGHVFDGGDVFASGSVLDVDGQDELFYREFDSPETNGGIVEDGDGEQAFSFFASARWGDFSLQGGANSRRKHVPTAAYGTAFGDRDTMTIDSRPFAELAYASETLVPGVLTSARVYYDGWSYHGTYILGSGAERVKNEDLGSSHWGGGELRARREIFAGNDLTVGAEASYHPHAHQENYNLGGERFLDDERSFGAFGVYAQDEWSPLPELRLVGGARFDRSYDSVEETSPRAALIWVPTKTTTVKLLYGQAFRAPNLYEQYYASPGVGFLAAPELEPEEMETYEIALEQVAWRSTVSASVYYYEIDELIDQTTVETAEGSLLQFRNLGGARAAGGEIALRVPLPRSADAQASYAFANARESGGARLTNSPRHLGRVAASAPLLFDARGSAELVLVGPRLTLQRQKLSTVTLLNLAVTSGAGIENLDCSAGLYNLLNQKYSDPGGSEHLQDRLPRDRFTYRVQLSYRF